MIVRESPTPTKTDRHIEWPPKSPRDAMASSPSGRARLDKYYSNRRPVSPSPRSRRANPEPLSDGGDSDDEETLQLKLKALEAKLKIKELKKAKAKQAQYDASKENIQVPLSPKRREAPVPLSESPRRVQLGIDKGLKASDVSLKRAKTLKDSEAHLEAIRKKAESALARSKSFSERLAESRQREQARDEKSQRREAAKSRSFGLGKPRETGPGSDDAPPGQPATSSPQDKDADVDPYSNTVLSRRLITQANLAAALEDKEVYTLPRLLKEVHAPDYDPPDVVDFVVFGIIASKSTPRDHMPTHKTTSSATDPKTNSYDPAQHRSKFSVLRLTDLKWNVDCFLFGPAFEAFRKLTVGTVIAILNPGIMPPKPHQRDSGNFSLKLGSSEDTVLEIGSARDLGFCKAVQRDGKTCDAWIDSRKTEFCEFHVNLQVERARAGRMEINSMAGLELFTRGPTQRGGGGGTSNANSQGRNGIFQRRNGNDASTKKPSDGRGRYYDREAHSSAYSLPAELQGRGLSTAALLDGEDVVGSGDAAERSRRRHAARERERELAQKLGALGSGLGGEYMRSARGDDDSGKTRAEQRNDEGTAVDAKSLGLLRGRGDAVSLEAVGRRRLGGGRGGGLGKKEAMGWSGAFKRGLPTPTREPSPKKTRLRIEGKGVRLPGRESLPTSGAVDEDDDDLDIV